MEAWAKWLVGFLAASFVGWAGVVYQMGLAIRDDLVTLRVDTMQHVTKNQSAIERLDKEISAHQRIPAHGEVLILMERLRSDVRSLQSMIERNLGGGR